jgi:monovalent cation/proton antiporter MnhG/PhaG subunit
MHRALLASVLVWLGVGLALICAFGFGIMKGAFERLHFSATVTSITAALVLIAVWLDDPTWQSRLKMVLIVLILFAMNSILSHSTARAIRVRKYRHFEIKPGDKTGMITRSNPTGARE